MKCPKCGFDIPEGDLFCPSCGAEIRIVPDYNLFEEDILSSMIAEDEDKSEKKNVNEINNDKKKNKKSKKNRNKIVCIVLIFIFCVLLGGFLLFSYFNSFSYLMSSGYSLEKKDNYSAAYYKYLKAAQKYDSAKAYTDAGEMQYKLNNKSKTEKLLYKAIDSDPTYKDAYKLLINIYEQGKNFDAISTLKENSSNSKIQALFKDIVTGKVIFSKSGGKYDDDIELTLNASGSYDIYYTLDGKDPGKSQGTKYSEPIILSEGETVVEAVCVNTDGKAGVEAKENYKISYKKPGDPMVSPESGSFVKPETITISSDGGCRIFYTWDGSDPNVNSAEYTGPIDMLPGNNVLSVIVIDKHDLSSNIVRKNYIFNQ